MVNEDAPHYLRRDSEKVDAVLPGQVLLVDQAEVGFVDESSSLQGVLAMFTTEVAMRQAVEFLINERHQLLKRPHITSSPGDEQLGYIIC
jgi:hypothetical protein